MWRSWHSASSHRHSHPSITIPATRLITWDIYKGIKKATSEGNRRGTDTKLYLKNNTHLLLELGVTSVSTPFSLCCNCLYLYGDLYCGKERREGKEDKREGKKKRRRRRRGIASARYPRKQNLLLFLLLLLQPPTTSRQPQSDYSSPYSHRKNRE